MKPETVPGYTFIYTDDDGTKIVYSVPRTVITHTQLTEVFVKFLKACGFVLPNNDVLGIKFQEDYNGN